MVQSPVVTDTGFRNGVLQSSARKRLFGLLVITASAACAQAAPVGQSEEPVSPMAGGTMQFAQRQASPHLDPFSGLGTAQTQTLSPVYEPLVQIAYKPGEDFRQDYPLVPWLAERWEAVDPTTYLFHIRQDTRWHDGQEVTAADVAFTYKYVLDPGVPATQKANLAPLDSFDATDRYTLRITSKGPNPALLNNLAGVVILPKHVDAIGNGFEKRAVGTGPFKVDSFTPNNQTVYVRHDGYWRTGKPYVNRIRMFMGMNDATQQAAFISRKIDLVTMQDKAQFEALQRVVPDVSFQPYLSDNTDSIFMKLDRPPFQDVRVRRAIHLALDRQDLVARLTYGDGGIDPPGINGAKHGWVIPRDDLLKLPGYRQPKEQDIAEAKRLLSEAGFGNGFRSTLKYVGTNIGTPQGAEAIAEQLKAIGVNLELQPTEQAQFSQAQRDGGFEAYYSTFGRFQPEQSWRQYVHSRGNLNSFPVRDPDLDRLIDAQDRELDEGKRKQLFIEIQRHLLDKLYMIPSFSAGIYAVWQPYMHDYVFNRARQTYPLNWGDIWLEASKVPSDR